MLRLLVLVRSPDDLFDILQVFAQSHDHFGGLTEFFEIFFLVNCDIRPEIGCEVRSLLL